MLGGTVRLQGPLRHGGPALPAHQGAGRACARPTRPSPTARRSTATPAAARASSPSRASTRASASSTSWPSTTPREPKSATFATYGHNQTLRPGLRHLVIGPVGQGRPADRHACPPSPSRCGRPPSPMDQPKSAPSVYLTSPSAGDVVGGRAEIGAAIPENTLRPGHLRSTVPVGTTAWTTLGTDDNAPYRVFHDVSDAKAWPKGTLLEYRAIAKDTAGHVSASSSYGIVGDPKGAGGGGGGGRPGHPARQRQRARRPQQRDGLCGRLVAGLRPGPALARPEPTRSGRGPTRIPTGRARLQGGDQQEVGRELRRGWRAQRRQHRVHGPARTGDLLLRPRHALGHVHGPGRRSSPRPGPSRPSSASAPTGARSACGRGCRTPTATAPTPGRRPSCPPGSTSSRSPTA